MGRKEFDRGAVFARVERGDLVLKEAAPLLKISYRQAKRMYKRFRTEGPAGLVHGGVGRVSKHARSMAERERVLEIIREHYGGKSERGLLRGASAKALSSQRVENSPRFYQGTFLSA